MNGKLRIDQPDGSYERYQGQIHNNMANGQGISKNRTYQYDGMFLNNQKHGYGIYYDQYEKYSGEWKHNLYHGYGKVSGRFGYGDCYTGEWVNGQRHGFGRCVYESEGRASHIYIGEWKHNRRNGYGIYKIEEYDYDYNDNYNSPPIENYTLHIKYSGQWENDQKTGLFKIYKQGEITTIKY